MIQIRSPLHDTQTAPLLAPRWRGLYFLKGGRTILGDATHDSEEKCRKWSAWFLNDVKAYVDEGYSGFYKMANGELVFYELFMFAIPVPI